MDMLSIYIANGVGIFILLILLYASQTRIKRWHTEDKIYLAMVLGVMLGCCMEAFSYTIDGNVFTGSRVLNYIANTYLFTANLLLPFCVLIYVDINLYGDKKRIWKHYKPQILIGVFMLLMNVVNFIVPVSYYITEMNVYERRPFSYFYYVVILYYCISAGILTKRYEKEHGARAFFNINMFLLPILVGAALQFMFYGLSLAWLSAAVGLTGLYMMQQNETSYIDPLLEIYNRRYMDQVIASWTGRGYRFIGMMVDVDDFKSINDRYGHSEGDKALMTLTGMFKEARAGNEMLFRFAGDEFIILRRTNTLQGLTAYQEKLTRLLHEYNQNENKRYSLEVSFGESSFDPKTDTIDSFMKRLDTRMYEMKEEHHKTHHRA